MHEITTERLRLRPLVEDDLNAHYATIASDPQVTWDHIVHSREQARATLRKRIRHWAEHGFGMYAVIDKATQQLIGHGGLQHFEQALRSRWDIIWGSPRGDVGSRPSLVGLCCGTASSNCIFRRLSS
jgi:RimJ/RimL family protein N-acetyltransferase